MNSGIRIIKRGTLKNQTAVQCVTVKTQQARERDTATTIQGWVAEWEERKRLLHISSFALIRGLDQSCQSSGHA